MPSFRNTSLLHCRTIFPPFAKAGSSPPKFYKGKADTGTLHVLKPTGAKRNP